MLKILRVIKKFFILIIIFLFLIFLLSRGPVYDKEELEYGVTFSQKQAEDLGLDWQQVYIGILDDLRVGKLRLSAYWNEIEAVKDDYLWEDLDWQINEASARKAQVILAVGGRLPRWPECHYPVWATELSKQAREKQILEYISVAVNRYKDFDNIIAWQVENEPFLSHFGDCPQLNSKFLDAEIDLVRTLDPRPIVVTDSGELSVWIPAVRRADIFGTTMYRDTYSKTLKRYIHYPIHPGFFRFKKNIANMFARPQKWIVIELQAEPWTPTPYQYASQEERDKTMNLQKFREILEFGRRAGFREFYLWGVEWWYWEREEGRPEMWEEARVLFKQR